MLKKRIIACLDVREGKVVKGVKFQNHEVMGKVIPLARRYCEEGADELVFYDIQASTIGKEVEVKWITQVAQVLDIPFAVAGGIRDVAGARLRLHAGADKISINSKALERPSLITELAAAIGQQSVVVGIDSRKTPGKKDWEVWQYTGSEKTMRPTGRKTLDWVKEVEERGAGEIVLNCMDQDGVGEGYDLDQLNLCLQNLSIPLVASGGAGAVDHFADLFLKTGVSAALAAGVFHRGTLTIPELKQELLNRGIPVRPPETR